MKNRSLYAVLTRFGIVAAVLTALLVIAPAATADEAASPCNDTGMACSFDENDPDLVVAEYSASDPEGAGIDWAIEGLDAAEFDITDGTLSFNESPNFEAPSDNGADNVYDVTIRATEILDDDQVPPAESMVLHVTVTVKDVDEPGSISLDRLQPQTGAALTADFSDPDVGQDPATPTAATNIVWLWSVPKVSRPKIGNDDHWQPAGINTSITNAAAYTPDPADAGKILRVKVSYNDAQSSTDIKPLYMLSYHEVRAAPAANDAPVFDSNADFDASVLEDTEDTAVGTVVGVPVTATDANSGDILSYTLTGADAASFEIDIGTGVIKTAAPLDHENGSADNDGAYAVTVNAFDPSNDTDDVDVIITATDVNEAPTVTGSATGTILEINSTPPSGYTYTPFASAAYTAADVDDGDTAVLSLSGDDAELFEIIAGVVSFKAPPDFEDPKDASLNDFYNINVVAEDGDGLTDMLAVTIEVTDVIEDGDVTLSTDQPAIGVPITARVSDPDRNITGEEWQWASADTVGGTFVPIDGATSATFTPREAVPDDPDTAVDETMASDEGKFLQVKVTYRDDASTTLDEVVMASPIYAVRAQPNVNTAPMFAAATIMREVNENETVNVGAPVTATDAEGDSIAHSISGGADEDAFEINEDTGQITVGADTELNYEDRETYVVEVTAEGPFGKSSSTMVTITVIDLNEAPEFVADNPDDYGENGPGPVATFTASDPELAGIRWTLVGPDAAGFSIDDNGVLTFNESPDFEDAADADTDNEYEITVKASEAEVRPEGAEGGIMSTPQDVTVTVKNVEEPGSISLTLLQPQTGVALTASVSDLDGGVTVTSWLWSVPKVNRPDTDNDGHWQDAAGTNNAAAYTAAAGDEGKVLRVKAIYTDGEGADKDEYKVSYHAVRPAPSANDAPTFSATGDYTRSIPEGAAAVGTIVGAPVTAADANEDDAGKLTYDLSGADAGSFKIDKMTGQITVAAALDHERVAGETYAVAVGVSDPSVNDETDPFDTAVVVRQAVTITATDVNEEPTVTGATVVLSVDENVPALTTPLGTFTATDPDAGDTTVLSKSGDDKDAFELSATGVLTFKASPNYESYAATSGDNNYRVTIVATDGDGLTDEEDLTIEVNNLDEGGDVTMSNSFQPTIGRPMVADLTDDDGGVNGAEWQWQSSTTETGTYADIDGATSDTYTPKDVVEDNEATDDVDESAPSDEGLFLRVTVTYRDGQSIPDVLSTPAEEGRRAAIMATSDNAVREKPDDNGAPAFEGASIMREVLEDAGEGDDVGEEVRATDPDGDDLTYEITGGADMDKFKHEGAQIQVGSAEFNYDDADAQQTFEVELTASDPFGGVGSTIVTITVGDVNEAPTLTLGGGENVAPVFADDTAEFMVDENADAGTEVGTVTADDPGDTLTYSVDSDDFAVDDDGNITTATMLDYEAAASHTVTVTATDSEGETASIEVTVTVGDMHPDCTVADNGLTNDCEALLDAKGDLGGDLNWDTGTAMADWDGVRMSDGRVSGIWLKDEGLDGSVSAAFGRVEMLTLLNLHSNMLSGPIPDLSGASMLEELYLANNADYVTIDDYTKVKVDGTGLTGEIPAWLNGMTNMTELWLWGNRLSGGIPDLSGMTSLDKLKLADNDLTGNINAMYLPQNVSWLIIDRNGFDGSIPDLSGLTSLRLLWLHSNALTGEIPDGSMFPASVDDLNLRDNRLTGPIPDLSALDMATRVRLHGNMLTGEVPASLGDLDMLQKLWLWDNQLTSINAGLGDLADTLIEIGLNGNPWADDACVPTALVDVYTNDYETAGIAVCEPDDGS